MNVLDLFSGIGGFSLGLERAGMRTVAFCEVEPYARAVLAKHWPDVPCSPDITTREFFEGEADVICGGFPCQDISNAGDRAGLAGERSGLWRELLRAIRVVRPIYAIVENVAALLGRGMGAVLGDLAEIGQDAEWHCIPARAVGAPHIRDRVWIVVADPARGGHGLDGLGQALQRQLDYSIEDMADADCGRGAPWQQATETIMGYRCTACASGGSLSDAIGQRVHVEPISVSERQGSLFTDGDGPICEVADASRCGRNGQQFEVSSPAGSWPLGRCCCECVVANAERFRCHEVVEPVAGRDAVEGAADTSQYPSGARWWRWWSIEPDVGRVAHGVPSRVDRLKGLGNAVVPQIPEIIGRAIMNAADAT